MRPRSILALGVFWALCETAAWAQAVVPASQPEREPSSIVGLLRAVADDARRLPSRETALILGSAGVVSLGVHRYDRAVTSRAAASPGLDSAFEPGEMLGGGALQAGGALATFVAGRLLRNDSLTAVGGDLVRAQVLNAALTQGLKLSFRRARPDGGAYSFPSGHTSSSFAMATVLGRRLGWRVGVPAHAVAAYVAASRLQENRHFFSDVVFGAAVGVVAGRAVAIGRPSHRLTLAPMVAPGTVGIAVSLGP
jgi:acid phosphatase family membrane protein YuiD